MNKKIVFTIIVAFLMTVKANAGNNNPASIEYVQSQITILLNYVNSKIANIPVTPVYTIGQHALGGIVFYVDSSGAHGLVAANNQFTPGQTWDGGLSNIGYITVNSTGSGVGAGAMNTSLSIGVQSAYAAVNTISLSGMAAQYCVNFSVQEDGLTACSNPGSVGESCYSDFYLPSLYELNQMFLRNSVLNIYPNSSNEAFFWSSTEDSASTGVSAWRINFSVPGGQAGSASKDSTCGAWCIRRF
jgi:hypothetical protein